MEMENANIYLSDPQHVAQLLERAADALVGEHGSANGQLHASTLADDGDASEVNESVVESSIESDDAWLVITVELGDSTRDIEVCYGDNPKLLAEKFCREEHLGMDAVPNIATYIAQHIEEEQAQMDMIEHIGDEDNDEDEDEEDVGHFDDSTSLLPEIPR